MFGVATGFDWLMSGKPAAKSTPAPVNNATGIATAPNGALIVPAGVDPFDVYWTGGGVPLPLPDSDPYPEPESPADDEPEGEGEPEPEPEDQPDQKSVPAKKKAGTATAAAVKKAAPKKAPVTAAAAGDSDDDKSGDSDQKAAYAAATAQPARRTGPFVCKIDVLKFMRKGCPLLKFGSYGYPHFRQFQLSCNLIPMALPAPPSAAALLPLSDHTPV
jgi:hypothetical protein